MADEIRDQAAEGETATLCIDIGGSHLKAGVVGPDGAMRGDAIRVPTPKPAGPEMVLQALYRMVFPLGAFARVAVGFPGVVRGGVVLTAPNLGNEAWHAYPLADALAAHLHRPVRLANDASVQGLGVIAGRGLEVIITLGTGLGFAMFEDGRLGPHLELNMHPAHGHKVYNDYVGEAARAKVGNARWNKRMRRVIGQIRTLTEFDCLLIGGGNARHLDFELARDVRVVSNEAGITGGVGLWGPQFDPAAAAIRAPISGH